MPLGFHVQPNDETPIRAGDDAISVLTAILTYVASSHEIDFSVAGLFDRQSSGKEHVEWTVTDSSDVDPPARRTQEDPELAAQMQREYYEHLKARFEPAG